MTEKNNDDWLAPKPQTESSSSLKEPEGVLDGGNSAGEFDPPITEKAEAELRKHERRSEQNLDYYPFADGIGVLHRTGPEIEYTRADADEVLRIVSSWYVKKNNAYHDVDNLQVKYQPHDIKQVIVQRMLETFPKWELSDQGWRDFMKILLDPPVNLMNPERSIPVWSGKRHFIPQNKQKIVFEKGTASINTWSPPAYRSVEPQDNPAFNRFLEYVIPDQSERNVFLDWLAWTLKYENQKPAWAILLYSDKQGTGKSTLADVIKALFGKQNTGRINGVSKLVSRFNKEVLENKLVVVEEVEVTRGSPQANSLKSLVTEDNIMLEAKHLPVIVEQIYCAFLMTTNHLPLWLEESDRRFYILNFDHQGYANGGVDYKRFTGLVGAVKRQISTDEGIKGIYDRLMTRDVPQDFGLKLDVARHRTAIMKRLESLSPDVAKQVLEETLHENKIVFVPVKLAHQVLNKIAPREINAQTHIFTELGWRKGKFAWDGGSQVWAWYLEVDPEHPPSRGKVFCGKKDIALGSGGWLSMSDQVEAVRRLIKVDEVDKSEEVLRVETDAK